MSRADSPKDNRHEVDSQEFESAHIKVDSMHNQLKTQSSLSDQTVETPTSIPPSPSLARLKSSFKTPASPAVSPIRPVSSTKHHPGPHYSHSSERMTSISHNSKTLGAKRSGHRQRVDNPVKESESSSAKSLGIGRRTKAQGSPQITPTEPPAPTVISGKSASPKSSATLRETIAKAKAAHRAMNQAQGQRNDRGTNNRLHTNHENMGIPEDNQMILSKRIAKARTEGRLNIAAMSLTSLPSEILTMYDMATLDDGSWAESVDLIKLVAADNDLSNIDERFLPRPDEDSPESVLGGLESLDIHGNHLAELPRSLANLQFLTALNLSKNRLSNDCFKIICQIASLRELRVTDNMINGNLDLQASDLPHLQLLDLSGNAIAEMPESMDGFGSLHTLVMSRNKLFKIPMNALSSLPLCYLDVSKNAVKGTLLSKPSGGFNSLKTLDCSFNAIVAIVGNGEDADQQPLRMPALQVLNASENRLSFIPGLGEFSALTSLLASGNQITVLPEGLQSLQSLKNVDLSRNDIRQLDDRIGLMNALSVFNVANNPLRERRLLNMNTEDLKQELRSRCEDEPNATEDDETGARRQVNGVLDQSSTGLCTLGEQDLCSKNDNEPIKTAIFHHNALSVFPGAFNIVAETLVSLDLAHNKLVGSSYVSESLHLPKLRYFDLKANAITTLGPLLAGISAPCLSELNISRNRLVDIAELRDRYPALRTLHASDNHIADLGFDSIRGLEYVDVSGNDITFLEPTIGLLANEGLRTLLVGANRFRVPRRDVVEKGTEAILTWLRGRIADE